MGILDDLLGAENTPSVSQSSARSGARWHDEPPPWAVVLHNIRTVHEEDAIRDDLFLIKQLNGGWWYLSGTHNKPLVSSKSFGYNDAGWPWSEANLVDYEIMEHPFTGKYVKADTINDLPVYGILQDFDQDDPDLALVVKTKNNISFYVKSESIRLASL